MGTSSVREAGTFAFACAAVLAHGRDDGKAGWDWGEGEDGVVVEFSNR